MNNQTFVLGGAEYSAPSLEVQSVLTEEGVAASFDALKENEKVIEFE